MTTSLQDSWYRKDLLARVLWPVSMLFRLLSALRRMMFRLNILKTTHLDVPVIVVGNITVGGSGKTPLVAWLVDMLRGNGYRPGIIARGYKGKASTWPQQVRPDSDPWMVGDEPVLLARTCQCPVAVGPDRVASAQALLDHSDCNIIVSDDGLQHYALGRDIEIAVIDGIRRFGNGWCLPAGPLREPVKRLSSVDYIVCNGLPARGEYGMHLHGDEAVNLSSGESRPFSAFAGSPVHAVAGIGNPERFFQMLRKAGLDVMEHPFPDHYYYKPEDLAWEDGSPILVTSKDAVKCYRFQDDRLWSVPVTAEVDEHLATLLTRQLNKLS